MKPVGRIGLIDENAAYIELTNLLMMIPAYINFVLLLLISGIHVYWGVGGNWGLHNSVPEQNGTPAFRPGRVATRVVALIFCCMAFFFLYKIGQLPVADPFVPGWVNRYGLWLLGSIFLLRAVGDFRYVGFTKKVCDTRFADLDTRFYSPLCVLLSLNTLLIICQPADF